MIVRVRFLASRTDFRWVSHCFRSDGGRQSRSFLTVSHQHDVNQLGCDWSVIQSSSVGGLMAVGRCLFYDAAPMSYNKVTTHWIYVLYSLCWRAKNNTFIDLTRGPQKWCSRAENGLFGHPWIYAINYLPITKEIKTNLVPLDLHNKIDS